MYTCNALNIPQVVGFDPEPSDMQFMPQDIAVSIVQDKIRTVNNMDIQTHLWPEKWYNIDDADQAIRGSLFYMLPNENFFVSALQNGTTTGVLREHAIRLNSSSGCTNLPRSEYPATCAGDRPFETGFIADGILEVRICAPGAYGMTPWTISRDRQDITEELWIDVFLPQISDWIEVVRPSEGIDFNFTLHCTSNTTRGYFEVPNTQNGNNPGQLLENWPSEENIFQDFNDYLNADGDFGFPSES